MRVKRNAATVAVRAGVDEDDAHGAVMPPVHLSANFSFAGFGQSRKYDYTRSGNPTRDLLAEALTELEGGAGSVVTGSGMSALDLVLNLVEAGETVIAPHDCYGGTHRLLTERAKQGRFAVKFLDQANKSALAEALCSNARMVLVESPSNPLLRIVDIAAVAAQARKAGARLVVDNTFLSPALQRPIDLGADLVVHSTTKYLNGHSDVIGGAVVAAHRPDVERLVFWANCVGVTGAPFDAYLTLRGLRTLFVRLERQQASALAVAKALLNEGSVAKVHYPGLPDHPCHALAQRQQRGFGAMLSFELATGVSVGRFVESLRLFTLAESLGGVESLVAHPVTMTHAAMDPAARTAAGISDSLLRLSIGLEHVDDLVFDLQQALAA